MKLRYQIIARAVTYTGRELRSGWIREQTEIDGDAAAGFVGPCDVANADLVDLDDARAGTFIRAARMAHVIVEHPGCDIAQAVLRQRLLVCILCETLGAAGYEVVRDGDDVYKSERKLTVSIAAPTPVSCVIHLGINIDPTGAPVPAIGLDELGLPAEDLLNALLSAYAREMATAAYAETKVRDVE